MVVWKLLAFGFVKCSMDATAYDNPIFRATKVNIGENFLLILILMRLKFLYYIFY